jgi:hypothetical protein
MSTPVQAPPSSSMSAPPTKPTRRPWLWLAIGIPIALLLVAAIVSFARGPREGQNILTIEPQPDSAEPADAGPAGGDGTRSAPLVLGSTARVGDYDVAIVEFVPDATDRTMAESDFNDAPSHDLYALVTLEMTYLGEGSGTPGMDLTLKLHDGEDTYADYQCMVMVPDSLIHHDDVTAGGSARGNFCLDIPRGALDGGVLGVEETATWGEPVFWALP